MLSVDIERYLVRSWLCLASAVAVIVGMVNVCEKSPKHTTYPASFTINEKNRR